MDYTSILESYGYRKSDRYISRMYIQPGNKTAHSSSTYHFFFQEMIQELSSCSKNDLYISMNDFNKPSRREENLHSLKHLYVDLDTYHSAYADLPYCNEYILQQLQEDYFQIKFPEPNLVVSSGRGLYLIWNIDEHKNALPRWKTIQKYLCNLLKDFGADPKVSSDAARVLRIPGSINTKSGREVTILSQSSEKHSLYEFLSFYMPDSYLNGIRKHEEIRKNNNSAKNSFMEKETVERNSDKNAKMECKISSFHSNKTLLQARLHDLETLLLQYRDREHGSKEYIFFLYRMWSLQLYKDSDYVNRLLLNLNSQLHFQEKEERLLAETKSAVAYFENKKIRTMKNQSIIDFLEITTEEMKSMTTIISKEEALLRKQSRNKASYQKYLDENGLLTKQDNIQLRYRKIAHYLSEGYTKKEISLFLDVSYRQVLRDCKTIQEIGIDFFSQPLQEEKSTNFSTHENSATIDETIDVTNIQPYLLQDVVLDSFTLEHTTISTVLNPSIPGYLSIRSTFMTRILRYTINNDDIISEPLTIRDYLSHKGYSGQNITDLKKSSDAVWLNEQPALLKQSLHAGDQLKIFCIEKCNLNTDSILATNLPFPVIYEDDDIIVVNKPAGMSIHPSLNHYTDTLANAFQYYFARKGESIPFRCINRLDKDTSGLTILAKHPISASILYQNMTKREIHREYLAIVEGEALPDEGVIDAPIGRKGDSIIERQVDYENGEHAVTHYRVIKRENGMSFLSLWLETGRTHQIRVHMKHIGYPLIGDDLYHPVLEPIMNRQALHSYRLTFEHPITGKEMRLTAPIPDDMKQIMPFSEDAIE